MTLPSLSNISPIWASLTINGGLSASMLADAADHQVVFVEGQFHRLIAALADSVGFAGEIDADGKPDGADVEHVRQTFKAHSGLRK